MTTDDDTPMNDDTAPPPPPAPLPGPGAPGDGDDEVVSAVLDGEASPDEDARVAGDPALRARLGELRAVAERVAAPVTPHASLDDLLDSALAVADTGSPSRSTPTSASPSNLAAGVLDLERARRTRERRHRLLAVAAVVAAVALAVPLLGSLRSGDTDSSETAGRFSSVGTSVNAADGESAPSDLGDDDAGTAAGSGAASDSASESGPATTVAGAPASTSPPTAATATGGLGALGDFPDAGSLVAVVRAMPAAGVAELDAADSARTSDPVCDALVAGLDPAGTSVTSGTATLLGQPVVVLVVAPVDPAQGTSVVIADPGCTSVLDRLPLDG